MIQVAAQQFLVEPLRLAELIRLMKPRGALHQCIGHDTIPSITDDASLFASAG